MNLAAIIIYYYISCRSAFICYWLGNMGSAVWAGLELSLTPLDSMNAPKIIVFCLIAGFYLANAFRQYYKWSSWLGQHSKNYE